MKRLISALALFACAALVSGQTTFVSGLVPNWDQPYDYPDPFDASGAGPDPNPGAFSPWDAWCTPTSASMLLGHWEDVRGAVGLADGSADGNQAKIPPGYLGPLWNNVLNPELWHDRNADGSAARGGKQVNDIGWYMDTNNLGMPIGNGAHVGTFYKDAAPGLNSLFLAIAQPAAGMTAATFGVNAAFGGWNPAQLANAIKSEIDSNRTLIGHFKHWNIQGPAGPGQGAADNDEEEDFGYEDYTWLTDTPGGCHDEEWNWQDGPEGLGHSVTMVGYTLTNGVLSHVIVHDNTPLTVRNVRVPFGQQLVAITTVVPEPGAMAVIAFGMAALAIRRRVRR